MNPPGFWDQDGLLPTLLGPIASLVGRATARRVGRAGWRAPVPVFCCGNAGVGGAGKTTLALDLAARLLARGRRPALLTRGHGGRVRGVHRVAPGDDAALVGDEALLLAAVAPCLVSADRAAGARAALDDGADVLVLDDGLQNPSLHKDYAILVIDGASGFGNGRVLPAGPLREPVAAAASRCRAAVLIGPDRRDAAAALPPGLTLLRASLRAVDADALIGRRVIAFAGIGRPGKFHETLQQAGLVLAGRHGFPDHHRYAAAELDSLRREAERAGAALVTTPKDFVRLPPAARVGIAAIGVALLWDDPGAWESLIEAGLAR